MGACLEEKKLFKSFPFARYTTDVTFQQTNRPTGNIQESKLYYSGKHNLYGYNVEVSVLPDGLAIGCSRHYAGSIADIDMLHKNQTFHEYALEKDEDEKELEDDGLLVDEHPDSWPLLADKGYQGAAETFRAIHPKIKPQNRTLTREENYINRLLVSDRIIVERFLGEITVYGLFCSKHIGGVKGRTM